MGKVSLDGVKPHLLTATLSPSLPLQGPTGAPTAPHASHSSTSSPGQRTCVRRSGPTHTNTPWSTGAAGAASRCGSTLPMGIPTWPWPSTTPRTGEMPLLRHGLSCCSCLLLFCPCSEQPGASGSPTGLYRKHFCSGHGVFVLLWALASRVRIRSGYC